MDNTCSGRYDTRVGEAMTALAMGSGTLPIFATPALVALMEHAACNALPQGVETVGVRIAVEHVSATPVGMAVWAVAVLAGQKGRVYTFTVEAFDEVGLIGRATHERVAVDYGRFMQRAAAKRDA